MRIAAALALTFAPVVAACGGIDYVTCVGPLGPGEHACAVTHGGLERGYLVHVPSAGADAPRPVVLSLHGRKGDPPTAFDIPELIEKADAEGFVAVAPAGIDASWNGGACCGEAHEAQVDDVGFIAAVLDELETVTAVDPSRIYVTGFSNGARLTQRLGCELADRVAAIAPIAGPLATLDQSTGEEAYICAPSRPMPVFMLHGTGDTCTPIDGGDGKDTKNNRSLDDVTREWSEFASCGETSVETVGVTTCTTHSACEAGAEVVSCRVEGGGHAWPGGDRYNLWRVCGGDWVDDFPLTDRIWRFFERHPHPSLAC